MKRMKHWRGRKPSGEITICWADNGVSFVQWAQRPGGIREYRKGHFMEAVSISARTYQENLHEFLESASGSKAKVHWVILSESFPHEGSEMDCQPVIPGWIARCWEGLELSEIPRVILMGRQSLECALNEWPEFQSSGTGLCLRIAQRILFLGQGNGRRYYRLSRKGLAGPADENYVSREWLLQTRLLFRNRTGTALRKVYIPQGRECHFSWENEKSLEIIPSLKPPAWASLCDEALDDGLRFLHLSAFNGAREPACRIHLPILEKRRHTQTWDRRLKIGSCLLLGGWSFLLLGACRHSVAASPSAMGEDRLAAFQTEVEGYEKRWQKIKNYETGRRLPYRLVGIIARSKPEAVELERIQLARAAGKVPGTFTVTVKGALEAKEPTAGFRGWVDGLRDAIDLDRIENLRFERSEKRIHFLLQGSTGLKGRQ
ncbi:hypothetical protein G0Q06_09645 [Puniceicoccales bacterium CK1056]|uniref:Uncharacterized protein n=1 Tax=Oceanipulchritudo coccoides TaxID=2706888 RepID=A0A6B2M320_9BACT|nr:hypothetical protein [Oceanipulchritudo coccoides]NDV62712.1 hypothetical protein [Oceanipulchritudo coccoides]